MTYTGCLIAVSDIKKSKYFYEEVMEQKVKFETYDKYPVVTFGEFSLQQGYEGLVGKKLNPKAQPDNFQLYFIVDDLDRWAAKIKSVNGIELLHDIIEYSYGQRGMRFYDFDKYIVEVAERLDITAKRLYSQGFTVEQIAERFDMSDLEFVQQLLDAKEAKY